VRSTRRWNFDRGVSGTAAAVRHPGDNTNERNEIMRYMMFVCTDTEPETDETVVPDIDVWVAENDKRGRRVLGEVLAAPSAATTVRVRNGDVLLTDGPFTETKEVIVGFDIIECADLDEAIEVARTHPMAYGGRIELRPFSHLSRD
jgi:hypothetical protein